MLCFNPASGVKIKRSGAQGSLERAFSCPFADRLPEQLKDRHFFKGTGFKAIVILTTINAYLAHSQDITKVVANLFFDNF